MSGPQVGDTIATAAELDALPVGALIVPVGTDDPWQRHPSGWDDLGADGSGGLADSGVTLWQSGAGQATLVYLPGRPPRPERAVKAEALREAAELFYPEWAAAALRDEADRIERGDLP